VDTERAATAGGKPDAWVAYSMEGARWLLGSTGFVVALWSGGSLEEQLHLFAPFLLLALAGMNGLEEILFSKHAATISGREPSVYQRQSGFNNLALAATGVVSFVYNWGPAADVALVTALLIFSTLSTADHFWRALADEQLRVRSLIRAAGTAALLIVVLPLLVSVARALA
jgi:hypothetical protein